MLDRKLVFEINKMADLLYEIKQEGEKFPNLALAGRKVLLEKMEELEKQIKELKNKGMEVENDNKN